MFSFESSGNHVLTLRQFIKFGNEFFPDFENSSRTLEIIYAKTASKKQCDFKCFIEILYKIHKEIIKREKKKQNDKRQEFRQFMDEVILPIYKTLVSKLYEYNIEKIQIFFQNSNLYENAIVGLFFESHNFLKHVKFYFFPYKVLLLDFFDV